MRTVNALLTDAAAAFGAALRGVFSSVCSLGRVEKVDGGQVQDSGRVFGFGIFGVLILALLVASATSLAYAQGAGNALDFDGENDYIDCGI